MSKRHGDFDNSFEPARSPSDLPSYHNSDGSHAMGEAQIEKLIEGFAQAARRAQILDLLAWYEGQLQHHQVDLRLNTPMEADEVKAFGADAVVIATGSLPDDSGFQRFGPTPGHIEGMHNANVWSVEDVMSCACRPGQRILLLDDGGHWRGCGTAWYLAEQGYQVTLYPGGHGRQGACAQCRGLSVAQRLEATRRRVHHRRRDQGMARRHRHHR